MTKGWSLQERRACNLYKFKWTPTLKKNMRKNMIYMDFGGLPPIPTGSF
jgi:hypothetical protein